MMFRLLLAAATVVSVTCLPVFEGDMMMRYEDVVRHYGEEFAETYKEAGKFDGVRHLAVSKSSGSMWDTRDDTGAVLIPWDFDESDGYNEYEQELLTELIESFTDQVPIIKFYRMNGTETDWVSFRKLNYTCSSAVGRWGGMQYINLDSLCLTRGTVHHEMLHTLGFFHEQSRPDRDEHVTVHFENIDAEDQINFQKRNAQEVTSLGTPYDYRSLLHYQRNAFSNNSLDTITPLNDQVIGNALSMSFYDKQQIILAYGCPSGPRDISDACTSDCFCELVEPPADTPVATLGGTLLVAAIFISICLAGVIWAFIRPQDVVVARVFGIEEV